MRRILLCVFFVLCAVGHAAFSNVPDSIDIKWMVDGNLYSQSTCEYGGDVILPTNPTKRGHTFVGWRRNYVELEYLESTGTQYIDTGVVLTQDSEIRLSFIRSSGGAIFGSRESPDENNIEIVFANNALLLDFNNSSYQQYRLTYPDTNNRVECILNKYIRQCNDVKNTTVCADMITTVKNAFLFSISGNPLTNGNMKGMFFYCQIYDAGVLVRDFIPVFDSDGIPCMYDRVTDSFFYNQGTGQFIPGPVKQ